MCLISKSQAKEIAELEVGLRKCFEVSPELLKIYNKVMSGKTCPKTVSGEHIWRCCEFKVVYPQYKSDETLPGTETFDKCIACGLIDDSVE